MGHRRHNITSQRLIERRQPQRHHGDQLTPLHINSSSLGRCPSATAAISLATSAGGAQTLGGLVQWASTGPLSTKQFGPAPRPSCQPDQVRFITSRMLRKRRPCMIDTGAEISCINGDIVHSARLRRQLRPSSTTIYGVGGNQATVLGEIEISFFLGPLHFRHRFLAVTCLSAPVILGCDFLNKFDISIHLRSGILEFNGLGVTLPMRTSRQAAQTCKLAAAATVRLQPGDGWIIPVRPASAAAWTNSEAPGVVCGSKAAKVMIGRSVSKLVDHGMGVAVINTRDETVEIKEGDIVGNFNPLSGRALAHLQAGGSGDASEADPTTATTWQDEVQIADDIPTEERQQVERLLLEFSDVFASPSNPGRTQLLKHEIDTGNARPIRQGLRRLAPTAIAQQKELVNEMLAKGVVRPSSSPWASPIVLVRKKDGSARFCLDYRLLNAVTKPDAFPMPRIDDTLDALEGNSYFSALDLESGYWQVEMNDRDKEKTAFVCHEGLFEFNVMPFGLRNAPATFQRLMQLVLRGLTWQACLVFIDDVIVMGQTIGQHNDRLRSVLERLREFNLRLKPSKCRFANTSMLVLGHRVSKTGITVDEGKTAAVRDWPVPRSSKDVKSFLGMTSYYRRFVREYANIAEPLRRLTLPTPFEWTPEAEAAFNQLKQALLSAPILAFPDMSESGSEFILDTDASDCAIGAVLSQVQASEERVIAYASRALSRAERNYCVTRRELLAVVEFVKKFRSYLLPRAFTVRVDHQALTYLLAFKEPEGQLARWLQLLDEFNFKVVFRRGRQHGNADALSRREQKCTSQCRVCRPGTTAVAPAETSTAACQTEPTVEAPVPIAEPAGRVDTVRVNSVQTNAATSAPATSAAAQTNAEPERQGTSRRKQQLQPRPSESEDSSEDEISDEAIQEGEALSDASQSLRELQLRDPDIGPVFRLLSNGKTRFSASRRDRLSPESLILAQKIGDLCFVDGALNKLVKSKPVPVIPRCRQEEFIEEVHELGHLGEDKTLAALKQRCYWPKMAESVRLAVRSCQVCQRAKTPSQRRAPLQTMASGFPMQRVGIDVVKVGLSRRGNDRLLTIVDYFTKWVELVPLPDEKAATIAKALFDNWVTRFGAPHILHSDRGKAVDGKVIRSLCRLLEIQKTRTSGYHPQCDGLVERFHRTLHQMLRCHLQSVQPEDWEEVLPHCLLAYRSSVNATTGFTPHCLLTGREMTLPVDVVYRPPEPPMTVGQFAANNRDQLLRAYDSVRRSMATAQRRQRRYYDRKAKRCRFRVGDLVWVFVPPSALSRTTGLAPKHQAPWTGPFRVLQRTSPVNYLVRPIDYKDGDTGRVVHANKLKRAHQPRAPDPARSEATSDCSSEVLDDGWVLV
ncbi:hypothetical protein BOX15_Mlig005277g1 [Macrostomum lignano]|uniref:RNA-directed DNA polymerase n=2 Tax=Macrostomum lignano TaxID=282301 RepID=A0A267E9K7_9PLAT|nr:hypothetical protein BOX15_Mlig005277g1 [Macrostomum lignano]